MILKNNFHIVYGSIYVPRQPPILQIDFGALSFSEAKCGSVEALRSKLRHKTKKTSKTISGPGRFFRQKGKQSHVTYGKHAARPSS